jgi:hypothetical protein
MAAMSQDITSPIYLKREEDQANFMETELIFL